jgi:hypothetical protein
MTASDFAAPLYHLLGTAAPRSILTAPVAVMVNNADFHRPSTAVIEFEGAPPFTLLMSNLRAPYDRRTLLVGRVVLREGEASTDKRELCELIEAFLAALGVNRDRVMAAPFSATLRPSKNNPAQRLIAALR